MQTACHNCQNSREVIHLPKFVKISTKSNKAALCEKNEN